MRPTILDHYATRRAEASQWLRQVAIVDDRTDQQDVFEADWADVPSGIPVRYKILSQVGSGGTGIVFKVRDLETGEIVALKVLKPEIASDQEMQQNLRKEVCLARKVTHKNVCRIHEFNRSKGTVYLSMEFVEGENLLSRLRRVGSLAVDESLEIARQICAGLREAHVQGIVHRDLKPANIMLDGAGLVKIMDFGIARLSQGNGQMTGTVAGTPAYMAPEQVELKPMGPRTDIYAVGLLLYEMVTGAAAFDGDTPIAVAVKQIRELPKRPCEIIPTLPAHIEAIILKCLRKDPTKRFQSVDELCVALAKQATPRISVRKRVSELQLPDLQLHRVFCSCMEKARAAVPLLVTDAVKRRHTILEANRIVRYGVQKASAFVRAQDLRAIKLTRRRLAAASTAVVLLAAVAAFGLGTRGKNSSTKEAKTSVALRSQSPDLKSASVATLNRLSVQGSTSVRDTIALDDVGRIITTKEVDLIRESDLAFGKLSLSELASKQQSPPSEIKSELRTETVKSQSVSTPSSALKNSAPSRIRPLPTSVIHTSLHAIPPSATPPAANTTNGPTIDTRSDVSATVLPTVTPDPTPKPTDMTNQQNAEESKSDSTLYYLEVGTFKDVTWADKAVDQLSRLGFHAVSIHKTHLWIQSYHVQVGPYTNSTDAEAAQKSLTLQGFKPHPAK
jgi:serine/threonine protein kinase